MDHPLLIRIDDLDTAIGNSADLKHRDALELAYMLQNVRKAACLALSSEPFATITARQDLAHADRVTQAAAQSDALPPGYPPLHKGPLPAAPESEAR